MFVLSKRFKKIIIQRIPRKDIDINGILSDLHLKKES
jgi:hypothetical protein